MRSLRITLTRPAAAMSALRKTGEKYGPEREAAARAKRAPDDRVTARESASCLRAKGESRISAELINWDTEYGSLRGSQNLESQLSRILDKKKKGGRRGGERQDASRKLHFQIK